MALPKWLGRINKRIFNPMELERGVRPVLTYVGRSSGETYRTPLDAHAVDGGYVFILNYGSDSDWVRNVLTAGSAQLTIEDVEIELVSPNLISKEVARQLLPEATKMPAGYLRITEYLRMEYG